MAASGGFSLGFDEGFDMFDAVSPSGAAIINQIYLNDFNKRQEFDSTWNK